VTADLSNIAAEVILLIKTNQLDKAQQLVQTARRAALASSFSERQKTVQQISLNLLEAKTQRTRILDTLNILSAEDQLLARPRVEQICRTLFDAQIADLKASKRQISRPRQGGFSQLT
jgi:Mg/Co/Ni transporter MgtE